MEGLYRLLYVLAWVGLPLGIGLQLFWHPPRGGEWGVYLLFALLFGLALLQGPRRAPRLLAHALGAYLLFELWRGRDFLWAVGFWSPSLYLLLAFAYPLPPALALGLLWAALLSAFALWAAGGPTWPWGHFALSQPVLLVLTLLLARFRELYGQVRFWRERALTCPLTGLPNRRALEMALEREAARVERGGPPFALVLLDLDGFKQVNDERGHKEGDRYLRRLAQALVSGVRRGDLVARWGGDEFAVLLPGTGEKEAVEVAERLGRRLREEGVSASLGVAVYAGDLEDLFLRADQALYRAKALGKGRVVLAPPQGRR